MSDEEDREKEVKARAIEAILEKAGLQHNVTDSELASLRERAVKAQGRASDVRVSGDLLVRLIDELQRRRGRS